MHYQCARFSGQHGHHDRDAGSARRGRESRRTGSGRDGIRAVAAGALTAEVDRAVKPDSGEAIDFVRAEPFRRLASDMNTSAAALAHRYALSMPGVDTVVLGVKNRQELQECLQAEALPRFTEDEMKTIEERTRGSIAHPGPCRDHDW